MSDTNRVSVAIARSTVTSAPIATSPLNYDLLRITGTPNLSFAPNTITSNEIRPDRQVSDLILVGGEAGGDGAFELSYGAFDNLIESTMFSNFVTTLIKAGTTAITAFGAGTITVDVGTHYQVGHIVVLADLATGNAGRGVYRITGIATNVLTVTPHTADTNPVLAGFTAQNENLTTYTPATSLQVAGLQIAAGQASLTVATNVATITTAGTEDLANLLGAGQDIRPGDRIKVQGFATAGNNVYARIRTGGTAGVIDFDAAVGVATEASTAGAVNIYFADQVRNGAGALNAYQYIVERAYLDHLAANLTDVRPSREVFFGMSVNQMSFQLQPQAIATASATFFGFSSATGQDTNGAGANPLYTGANLNRRQAPQNDVYNTSSNVGRIGRGVSPVAAGGRNFVLEATIDINNNLRRQNAVGVFGAAGIGVGELSVTGSLQTYFDSLELLDQVVNNTETSLDVTLRGNDGRAMAFDMPRIKFSGGAPDVPGKNQDVVINLTYQAILSTLGYTISVSRFPYAA